MTRLRKLAPSDINSKAQASNPMASSWRWTLQRLDDAREALDDLAYDYYYGALAKVEAAAATAAETVKADSQRAADDCESATADSDG